MVTYSSSLLDKCWDQRAELDMVEKSLRRWFQVLSSMPVFCPSSGGYGMPIGRLSGTGVNSSTRLPYPRGAAASCSEGGGTTCLGGACAAAAAAALEGLLVVGEAPFLAAGCPAASHRYDVLKERLWHRRQSNRGRGTKDMARLFSISCDGAVDFAGGQLAICTSRDGAVIGPDDCDCDYDNAKIKL